MPASDNGVAVVDVVPTYAFTGRASGGTEVSRELVAVDAAVVTPSTAPGPKRVPNLTVPPIGAPEPQPLPVSPPTVSGKPPT
jgi:hypothetical protein